MSDTVYEKDGIAFTRFWAHDHDNVQITLSGENRDRGYAQMTKKEFHSAVVAIEKNIKNTKNAWWHTLARWNKK